MLLLPLLLLMLLLLMLLLLLLLLLLQRSVNAMCHLLHDTRAARRRATAKQAAR